MMVCFRYTIWSFILAIGQLYPGYKGITAAGKSACQNRLPEKCA